MRLIFSLIFTGFVVLASVTQALSATPLIYQGQLKQNNSTFSGTVAMEFQLYDALEQGAAVGAPITKEAVSVVDGLFQVSLAFNESVFDGTARYLEIIVDQQTLSPRQAIGSSPSAYFAFRSQNADTANQANIATEALSVSNGAIGATQTNPNEVQSRVSASCADGLVLSAINSDGSVQCTMPPGEFTYTINPGKAGSQTDMALRPDGRPFIVYVNDDNDLLTTHDCADIICSTGVTSSLKVEASTPSVTIRPNGRPLIAYYEPQDDDLVLANCIDASCQLANFRSLAVTGDVGRNPRIAMRSTDLPIVAYISDDGNGLSLHDCNDVDCSSGTNTEIVSIPVMAFDMALKNDDTMVFAYQTISPNKPILLMCSDVPCQSPVTADLASDNTSISRLDIALDDNEVPLVLMSNFSSTKVDLVICSNNNCAPYTSVAIHNPSTGDFFGGDIVMTAFDRPYLVYLDRSNGEMATVACSTKFCLDTILGDNLRLGDVSQYSNSDPVSLTMKIRNGREAVLVYPGSTGELKIMSKRLSQ
ncbi:MAG TPA: hypothetical protein VIC53_08675 [Wenzhouxiangella sp.]